MPPARRRSSIPLVRSQKSLLHQRVSEIRNSCVDVASPFVNGRMVNRTTSPSHVGFLMIPYESIKYNNSFTMLLVRDFTENLQFLGLDAWTIFPSSSCPKLAAHTTKHIAVSLPGTPRESVVPPRDSSNRERKTLGSSSGPRRNGCRGCRFHVTEGRNTDLLWTWNWCQKSDWKKIGRSIGIALGGRIGNVNGV